MPVFNNVAGNPVNPNFAELVISGHVPWSNGGVRPIVQIYHLQRVGGNAVEAESNILAEYFDTMDTPLAAALPVSYTGVQSSCRFMDDPTRGAVLGTVPSNGSVTGDRATLFNAVCVQMRTDGRGRNYRGSKHYAPVSEAHTTLDNLNGTGTPLWQAVADAMDAMNLFVSVAGNTWSFIVLSPSLSDLTANPAIFSGADLKTGGNGPKLNLTVGTMRRRKEKQGVA